MPFKYLRYLSFVLFCVSIIRVTTCFLVEGVVDSLVFVEKEPKKERKSVGPYGIGVRLITRQTHATS